MEFGAAVGLDGLVGSDLDAKKKLYGSGFFKQLGRPYPEDADGWRVPDSTTTSKGSAKVARLSDDIFSVSAPKAAGEATALLLPQRSSSDSFFSDAQRSQHMLCFSTPSSLLYKSESQSPALPCFGYAASAYSNNAGLSSGGLNGGNMQGMVLGWGRGPFTPSQRMELEHQALIYKYINANVPVPSNLLIPIRKAFESAGFCYAATGFTQPSSLAWGGFQLGFSSSTDPEQGRCRRTDGKKWRCSRDAVVDQKYCERHLNRGRHRSRKPVEGQNSGHPVSGGSTGTACAAATTPATAAANKQGLPLNILHHSQSGALGLSADSSLKSLFMNKEDAVEKIQNPSSSFSLISTSTELKSKIDSLHTTPSLLNSCQNLGTLKDLTGRITGSDHSICQFMNNWPGMNVRSSEMTHSLISAPVASHDDKVTMNLGFGGGTVYSEHVPRQTMSWIPTSSEASIGGPLGEVLHSANNSSSSTECKNSSFLNLMTEGWESSSSSPLGSSPTGVLQRTAFGSVSNSEQSAS